MSDVPLKEHIDVRFDEFEKRLLLLNESAQTALDIQTRELERRLDLLNHEHARALRAFDTYVPRNVYEVHQDSLTFWKSDVEKWRNRVLGIIIGLSLCSGVIGALLVRLLKI